MMEETRLFSTLQETLQLTSDVHKKSELSVSPWVTFVGKDGRFQTMLRRITSKPLVSRFPRVIELLKEVLQSDVVRILNNSGYPLDEYVQE